MNTKYVILIMLILGVMSRVNGQNPEVIKLCSGNTAELEVTAVFAGSVFEWSEMVDESYSTLDESSGKLAITIETVETLVKNYRCIYFLDGAAYDTSFFEVTVNPNPQMQIMAGNLCEGQMADFDFITSGSVAQQEWNINGDFYSLIKNPDYLCQTTDDLSVSLKVTNTAGCFTTVDTVLFISTDSGGEIAKIPQVTRNKFVRTIDCGNSITVYNVDDLDENSKVVKWEVFANDELVLKVDIGSTIDVENTSAVIYSESAWVSESLLKVKWENTTESKNILVKATYANGDCSYETSVNSILLDDNSPDSNEVFQKPESKVLILPAGINEPEFNYLWGYTASDGSETTLQNADRHFCEFDALVSGNQYWVETWYTNNDICRVRNFLTQFVPVSKSAEFVLKAFPNPVTTVLNISMEQANKGNIELSDLSGVLLKSLPVDEGQKELVLNVNDLHAGSYLLTFKDASGNLLKSQRVVVK